MEPPELYLDAAATTPPLPAVIAVMQQLQQTAWANPSSLHGAGLVAAEALERARWSIAERFAVNPDQLIVTSGATESVHLALLGSAAGLVPPFTFYFPCLWKSRSHLSKRSLVC